MSDSTDIIVSDDAGDDSSSSKLLMAWARDIETGEPRYIRELPAHRGGAKCGCECVSCGLPLTGVNVAKSGWQHRPHFRHPTGVERDECLVLAARFAALRQLQDEGWLQLPRRRRSARVAGLSGQFYEAWVEQPAERVQISRVDYSDRTAALLTLNDGRRLLVSLVGSGGTGDAEEGDLQPTIVIEVNDPAASSMSPEELRSRLELLPDALCWRAHWSDAELRARAEADAREQALGYLDAVPDGLELPDDLGPALRRESVLHFEVKRILAEAGRMAVPGLDVAAVVPGRHGGQIRGQQQSPSSVYELDLVELEKRFGRLVPDVTCKAWPEGGGRVFWPMLIEVTVTNVIDGERLERIRATGETALEIDLSLTGGRVTRDELRRLVLEETAAKRWLFHPDEATLLNNLRVRLDAEAALQATAIPARPRREFPPAPPPTAPGQPSTTLAEAAREYLAAVTELADTDAQRPPSSLDRGAFTHAMGLRHMAVEEAQYRVADAARELALHGFPEACDENLVIPHGILPRLLSIKFGRPVGYQSGTLKSVLAAIKDSGSPKNTMVTLFMIAVRTFKPDLSQEDWRWFERWAAEVRHSIRKKQTTYLRDPVYDRLLGVLFPEMVEALAKPVGKRVLDLPWDLTDWRTAKSMGLPPRRRAYFIGVQQA